MKKAVFFDLFYTLIKPIYYLDRNENDVLGITVEEWEKYAEEEQMYYERAIGNELSPIKIIENIVDSLPYQVSSEQKKEILNLRENRMKYALENVDGKIIDTVEKLHNSGVKLCLISNADVIDCKYWENSKLSKWFDLAVFSCYARALKPDRDIYITAMNQLKVEPIEAIFVGDGGSDELRGAKAVGMQTVFTEYLDKKDLDRRKDILKYADYSITNFSELISIIKR